MYFYKSVKRKFTRSGRDGALLALAVWQVFAGASLSFAGARERPDPLATVVSFLPGVGVITSALVTFAVARITDLLQEISDNQYRMARAQGVAPNQAGQPPAW